jgi:hypothetical protein
VLGGVLGGSHAGRGNSEVGALMVVDMNSTCSSAIQNVVVGEAVPTFGNNLLEWVSFTDEYKMFTDKSHL